MTALPVEIERPAEAPADHVPCRARPRNKTRMCGKPATHDIMLSCLTCGYNATRPLCARHARKAEGARWYCGICMQWLAHFITSR